MVCVTEMILNYRQLNNYSAKELNKVHPELLILNMSFMMLCYTIENAL